jgi:hypothetical protein
MAMQQLSTFLMTALHTRNRVCRHHQPAGGFLRLASKVEECHLLAVTIP